MTQPPQPGPWGTPQEQPPAGQWPQGPSGPGQPAWQPSPGPGGPPQGWPPQPPNPWPGQQQPPPYGTPNPMAGFPPAPKRSGIKPWMWIVGVLVLLTLIAGVLNTVRKAGHHTTAAGDLKPGQCITNDDYIKYHFTTTTSCESSDAVYELAGETAMGICPDGKRVQDGPYFYVTRNQDDPKSESLCFALNLHQGDCYAMDLTEKSVTHIDCAQASTIANSHTGAFKVAKRADGSTDGTTCSTGDKPWVFTSPQRVYCLTKLVE